MEDLAVRWKASVSLVRKMRSRRMLPPPVLVGDLPRWSVKAITKWEKEHTEKRRRVRLKYRKPSSPDDGGKA
jgi:hypothetical protein